jgi:L-lactate dehydrogenase (cytochrome)
MSAERSLANHFGASASHINVADFRAAARRRLPLPVRAYLEGGADDGYSLERNRAAYSAYELIPRYLVDVSDIDLAAQVLGTTVSMPVMLSPTGMSRLFHPDAELAVARAAAGAGTMYTLSTVATESIESVADVSSGPRMFQIYVLRDAGVNSEFIQRCKTAGYTALCLTVDVPAGGNRENDRRTGMAIPPRFTWRSKLSFALHPRWSLSQLRGPAFDLPNVSRYAGTTSMAGLMDYVFSQFDPSVTWEDAERMIKEWDGPFAIKGILSAEDARRAADIGATAVIVSNHGGRQLDGVPGTLDALPAIADAVGDRLDVLMDGGIRRGTDVLKALALGARACMIGRPYIYGLSVAGEAGVRRVLEVFREELIRDLALLGCLSPSDVSAGHLRRRRSGQP